MKQSDAKPQSNQTGAVDGGITRLFQVERRWPAATDPHPLDTSELLISFLLNYAGSEKVFRNFAT